MNADRDFVGAGSSGRLVTFAALCLLVAGCGDGDSEPTATSTTASGSVLTISGSPPSQILVGDVFSFSPTVGNPDDIAVTFSASNLPLWATLDPETGLITGVPKASDVGVYSNIRLTVSGGGTSATTPAYSVEVVSVATGSASLSWLPPTERTDGSVLTDLSGYKIYYGQSESRLTQVITISDPGVTAYVIENLTPATWYFAASAYDSQGVESVFSNVASKTIM